MSGKRKRDEENSGEMQGLQDVEQGKCVCLKSDKSGFKTCGVGPCLFVIAYGTNGRLLAAYHMETPGSEVDGESQKEYIDTQLTVLQDVIIENYDKDMLQNVELIIVGGQETCEKSVRYIERLVESPGDVKGEEEEDMGDILKYQIKAHLLCVAKGEDDLNVRAWADDRKVEIQYIKGDSNETSYKQDQTVRWASITTNSAYCGPGVERGAAADAAAATQEGLAKKPRLGERKP
jgi:hypothetical protein